MQIELWGVMVILAFLLLLIIGVHVAFALTAPSVAFILISGESVTIIGQNMIYPLFSYTTLAIPLFIFVGVFLNEAGLTEQIFNFCRYLLQHVKGGLAYVNILGSLLFSGISGAALADIGGIGRMMIFAMDEDGYDTRYSAALTTSSSVIGPIFPPSIPLIMYGLIAQEPIIPLFLAGVGPALVLVVGLMITTFVLSSRRDFPKPRGAEMDAKQFVLTIPAIITPLVLLAGMLTGLFGPTEIAGVAVMYSIFLSVAIYRDLELASFMTAAKEAAETTSTILFTIAGATLFAYVMSITMVPRTLAEFVLSLTSEPALVLLIMMAVILIMGAFVEALAAMLMLTPIFLPLANEVGIGSIHFGIIIVYGLMIGLATPPFGVGLFLVSDIADVKIEEVVKKIVPYYIPLIAGYILIAYVPFLSVGLLEFY